MHPPLFKDHPDCKQIVQDLVKCHEEKAIGKFFGACNDAKVALDQCFKAEKELRRKAIAEQGRERERDYQKFMAEYDNKKS